MQLVIALIFVLAVCNGEYSTPSAIQSNVANTNSVNYNLVFSNVCRNETLVSGAICLTRLNFQTTVLLLEATLFLTTTNVLHS